MKSKNILFVIALLFHLSSASYSQEIKKEVNKGNFKTHLAKIAIIHDDFNDPNSLTNWINFAATEGWPDRITRSEIDKNAGSLLFEPKVGAWFWGGHGAYIYKEIEGNFIAIAKIKVRGKKSETPSVAWSRGGLLLRQPPDLSVDKLDRNENFLHIMRVEDPDRIGIYTSLNELKNEQFAKSESSNLQTKEKYYYRWKFDGQSPKPASSTWVEIGIVRIDNAFFTISKYEDQDWMLRRQNFRTFYSDKVQIGLAAASVALEEDRNWIFRDISPNEYNEVIQPTAYGPDVVMEVDYFSVIRPELTDSELSILTNKNIDEDHEKPAPKEAIEKIINRILNY